MIPTPGEGNFGNSHSIKKTQSYLTSNEGTQTKEHVPSPDFKASDTSHLQIGQKVEHQKFGFGEVMKMEGAAHNPDRYCKV